MSWIKPSKIVYTGIYHITLRTLASAALRQEEEGEKRPPLYTPILPNVTFLPVNPA